MNSRTYTSIIPPTSHKHFVSNKSITTWHHTLVSSFGEKLLTYLLRIKFSFEIVKIYYWIEIELLYNCNVFYPCAEPSVCEQIYTNRWLLNNKNVSGNVFSFKLFPMCNQFLVNVFQFLPWGYWLKAIIEHTQ